MANLAQTLRDFASLMTQIEENSGEISDEMLPLLSRAELAISQKIDNYVNFHDVVKGQVERTKKNIDNFKKTLQTLENLEFRLKTNVKHIMEEHAIINIDGNERSIKLINSGGIQATQKPEDMFQLQECVNPKYILELDHYVEEKIIYVIRDKSEFKEAVKENKIHSCFLLPRSKYVKFI